MDSVPGSIFIYHLQVGLRENPCLTPWSGSVGNTKNNGLDSEAYMKRQTFHIILCVCYHSTATLALQYRQNSVHIMIKKAIFTGLCQVWKAVLFSLCKPLINFYHKWVFYHMRRCGTAFSLCCSPTLILPAAMSNGHP